ncbi:hypothetical protein N7495_007682 [Penicillium taxi]|uniref:uncharacterized protein n=1 Tax=Penicillium taxi TaxID=168475 RepID=UPI0025450E2A|nr:uncharacterized protein N7495_007682 [Penicillium taxi]KAJ5887641.1 hypothetical protein N7495_007682 [Penicillium taxi]
MSPGRQSIHKNKTPSNIVIGNPRVAKRVKAPGKPKPGQKPLKKGSPKKTKESTSFITPQQSTPQQPTLLEHRTWKWDFDVSYVGRFSLDKPNIPMRRPWPILAEAIMKPSQVPDGWTSDEPDLDPENVDAQIARCHERIQENILPYIFELRLLDLQKRKIARDAMMAAELGLPWETVQQLDDLKGTMEWLREKGDEWSMIPTLDAIMTAYRSGRLACHPGLVTYWSNGVQLCQPRPFDWDEVNFIMEQEDLKRGFWVERAHISSLNVSTSVILAPERSRVAVNMPICIRLPHQAPEDYFELDFLNDTGADIMLIFADDLTALEIGHFGSTSRRDPDTGFPAIRSQPLGVLIFTTANGQRSRSYVYSIMVNLFNGKHELWLPEWIQVECVAMSAPGGDEGLRGHMRHRLNGPFLRYMLFTATCPNNEGKTYLFDSKEFVQLVQRL